MKRTLSLSLATIAVLLFAAATSFDTASAYGPAPVTFSKDVAPIVFQHCASCHNPGGAAPFSEAM